MKSKINILRDLLHKELIHGNLNPDSDDYKKVLKLSQELDILIAEYYREDNKRTIDFPCQNYYNQY